MIRIKKRENEEAVTSQESTDYPVKKLRLIFRERTAFSLLDDVKSPSSDELSSVRSLNVFSSDFVHKLKQEDIIVVIQKLTNILKTRSEVDIQCLTLEIIRQIVEYHFGKRGHEQISNLLNELVIFQRQCKSSQVYVALLALCNCLVHTSTISGADFLSEIAINSLEHSDWQCRANALKMLTVAVNDRTKLETALCKYCSDHDPRVRLVAAENLLILCQDSVGFALTAENYQAVCGLLSDSCESVRLVALKTIKIFADAFPDRKVSGPNAGVQLRLVDDAFSKMCHALYDLEVQVRAEAARLLGEMENVSNTFLDQTLDKKLMSKMRFGKSGRITQRDKLYQEWSTGKKLGEDIPAEKLEEDSVSLIPSGACGAFVTGLEDEFLVVRQVAVRSLSRLAASRPSFASKAMDFLADMFNDEIEQVRLDAINCLLPLVCHDTLQEHQMEVILNVLDDAMSDSRSALRELLCQCHLATKPCMKMTIDSLLNNLKRYPADRDSIWNCMKHLGNNHPQLVQPLVADLLGFHPFFAIPEPKIEDFAYISKLVLVLNAAAKVPTIRALFVPHTWRHYHYLKDSVPHLVPSIGTADQVVQLETSTHNGRTLLKRTYEKMIAFGSLDEMVVKDKVQVLSLLTRDLERMSELDDRLAPSASFLHNSCLLMTHISELVELLQSQSTENNAISVKLHESLTYLMELSEMYGNLEQEWVCFLVECRLRLLFLTLIMDATDGKQVECGQILRQTLTEYYEHIECSGKDQAPPKLAFAQFLTGVLEQVESFEGFLKPNSAPHMIGEMAKLPLRFPAFVESSNEEIRKKTCKIVEPDSDSEFILKFVARMVTSVSMTAFLRRFESSDFERIRIRIVYPDMKEQLFRPRSSDFRPITSELVRLKTDVLLSADVWNESATVKLSVVLLHKQDDLDISSTIYKKTDSNSKTYTVCTDKCDTSSTVNMLILPKSRC